MKSIEKGNETDNKNSKIVILLCAVVIVILLGMVVFLLQRQNASRNPLDGAGAAGGTEEPKRNVVVTESNAEEAVAEMAAEDFVEPGYYTVNMTTEWHFPAGDAISLDARVDNVLGNTNPVYFDIFLENQEDEPIYKSPVIPVGSFLEYIALEKVLDAGNYDCVMVYHLVDEEQNTVSTLRVKMKIVVET